jgi:hypothetical protein
LAAQFDPQLTVLGSQIGDMLGLVGRPLLERLLRAMVVEQAHFWWRRVGV